MDLHTGTSPRGVKKLKAVEKAGIVSRSGVTNYVRRLKLVHNLSAQHPRDRFPKNSSPREPPRPRREWKTHYLFYSFYFLT